MLTIRAGQKRVFEQAAMLRFEDEMVEHSQAFSPKLCRVLGEEQLRVALRESIERAGTYGFTLRGPIRLYVEMMFLYGSRFDTDPQYRWAGEALNHEGAGEMDRANQLHAGIVQYQKEVSGPDAMHTVNALRNLLQLAGQIFVFAPDEYFSVMHRELGKAFPEKARSTPMTDLTRLFQEARAAASQHLLPAGRPEVMMGILMFAFGHGCVKDPLYPWIAETLADPRIVDAEARANRLEKKALTWLEHVLNSSPR